MVPIKTKQKSDNLTIQMDDDLHKVKKSTEPVYEVVEICKDKESNNDNTVKMHLNPAYNVSSTIKVDSNVHKDKGSTAKTNQKFK